jgi:hypothetical protein
MYGNSNSGFGKNSSRFGKDKPEDEMASVALQEATDWLDELMDREFSGRGDKEYLIRHRISKNSGVPERYLYRLQYQAKEMKDVAGEYYRRLRLYYESACQRNEAAADRYKDERLGMRGHHEKVDEKSASAGVGMDSSQN